MRVRKTRSKILFKRQRETVCPACLDRGAITLVGRPVRLHGIRLTGGCEVCGGTGHVTVAYLPHDKEYDPWVQRSFAEAA